MISDITSKSGLPAYDVLRMPVTALIPGENSFGLELDNLITSALVIFQRDYPGHAFSSHLGLLAQLRICHDAEPSSARRAGLMHLINAIKAYFNLYDPANPELNDGQVRLFSSPDKLAAFATITPPRGNGNMPTISTMQGAVERARIRQPVDYTELDAALQHVREHRDLIWCLPIAQGSPPIPAQLGTIDYQVPVVDKVRLYADVSRLESLLLPLGKPVKNLDIIGRLRNSKAKSAGVDLFGKSIPAPDTEPEMDLGDDITISDSALIARTAGYVFVDGQRLDIVPVYVMNAPPPGSVKDFSFPGTVLVQGNLHGPGSIECDDLFILGNCEQMTVVSRNDVLISGGIIGHNTSTFDVDGRLIASFISEARVSALREVLALNAIINSQVVSNQAINVTSPKGMIAGGKLMALRGISAATLGSEFGMLTETVVGKDFLSSSRLEDIAKKILLHEANLRRIQELKSQLLKSRVRVDQMAPDKQEIYIGILKKEQNSQTELKSLIRRKKTLNQSLRDFLTGSIQVMNSLFPPVRVQIGDAIREIREKLNAVTLTYDPRQGIVSDAEKPEEVKS